MRKIPRVLLAAGASGSGKTLITCGLLQALINRKYKVSSFKCGPDYIDPMFHSQVIGAKSRNLDTFFTGETITRYLLCKNSEGTDISIMEGVMGYYDGVAGITSKASAYDLAKTTKTPAILIVNSKGMSVSLVAYIKGFLEYKKESYIKGVIFNQMSPMLYQRMKALVEEELGIQVLGYVPKVEDCVIESRHLGLVLPEEIPELKERLNKLAKILENSLDIDGILELASKTEELETEEIPEEYHWKSEECVKIGVAKDEAFCFFYEDNFRLLEEMGAKLEFFSPIHDSSLPEDIDGILLYGGYPELNGEALEKNHTMKQEILKEIKNGIPCLAECGGFMYLHEEMEDMNGIMRKMIGAVKGKVYKTPKLTRFGYITLHTKETVLNTEDLGNINAHEFHYFDSENCGNTFRADKPESKRGWECIHGNENMIAGFPHLYYFSNPEVPKAFIKKCVEYKRKRIQGVKNEI